MWAKKWGLRSQWGARSSCTQVFENIIQKFICIHKGSGDDIEGILALGGGAKKCKPKDDVSGADALAAALGSDTCDMDGMDEKVNKYCLSCVVPIILIIEITYELWLVSRMLVGCLEDMQSRVQTLEQALLSGEGGAIEEQITLTLVKKGK